MAGEFYLDVDILRDPLALADDKNSYLELAFPGYQAQPASPTTLTMEAQSQADAETRELAASAGRGIAVNFGTGIFQIGLQGSTSATITATITLTTTGGYTIPEGTEIGIAGIGFQLTQDIVIPAGVVATTAGAATFIAIADGSAANGLFGPVDLIDTDPTIQSIVFEDTAGLPVTTTGGFDGETLDDYRDRLVRTLSIYGPNIVVPRDFEIFGQITGTLAGIDVSRVLAVNGYNPADSTENNERYIAVFVHDSTGAALSTADKDALLALYQAKREVNFGVTVNDPSFGVVKVTVQVQAWPDWTVAACIAEVQTALSTLLDPKLYGQPPQAQAQRWVYDNKVRYTDVVAAIETCDSVHYIVSGTLTIGLGAGAMGTTDLTLTGRAPLTQPGVLTVTALPG